MNSLPQTILWRLVPCKGGSCWRKRQADEGLGLAERRIIAVRKRMFAFIIPLWVGRSAGNVGSRRSGVDACPYESGKATRGCRAACRIVCVLFSRPPRHRSLCRCREQRTVCREVHNLCYGSSESVCSRMRSGHVTGTCVGVAVKRSLDHKCSGLMRI